MLRRLYHDSHVDKRPIMIKKANAKGDIVLDQALAGYIFDVQEQGDGSIRLTCLGRYRGKKLMRSPMPVSLFRKLAKQASQPQPA
jgi:hypothetical protein